MASSKMTDLPKEVQSFLFKKTEIIHEMFFGLESPIQGMLFQTIMVSIALAYLKEEEMDGILDDLKECCRLSFAARRRTLGDDCDKEEV